MKIDERIKIERDSLEIAIFPRERKEHAEKLAELERQRDAETAYREAQYFIEPVDE